MSEYHGYYCGGCGHTTVVDKYYKIKLIHCAVCGEKSRMEYQGEYSVEKQPRRIGFTFPLRSEVKN